MGTRLATIEYRSRVSIGRVFFTAHANGFVATTSVALRDVRRSLGRKVTSIVLNELLKPGREVRLHCHDDTGVTRVECRLRTGEGSLLSGIRPGDDGFLTVWQVV